MAVVITLINIINLDILIILKLLIKPLNNMLIVVVYGYILNNLDLGR